MPRDCPHNHCRYFLAAPTALCPGCGRPVKTAVRRGLPFASVIFVLLVLVLLPVRSSWIAGSAIVAVGIAATVLAARPAWTRPLRASATSIEDRYRLAVDDARHWLGTWGELRAIASESMLDDERSLRDEALHAAEDAAREAIQRRDRHASRFLANGFERLDYLEAQDAEIDGAIAIIEHYLDTLWLDSEIAALARHRVGVVRPSRAHRQLVQTVGTMTLLDSQPTMVHGDLEAQRFRLQAERRLLNESPLADIEAFHDF